MHHPHTAMRPAVPEGTYGRRRAGSIVPAVPSMSNITAHHYIQPPTPLAPTIPIQQPPPPPICTAQQLEPIVGREYFKPPLPWYSAPGPFPRRHRRRRRQLPLSQPRPTSPRVDEPTIAPPATPPTVTPPSEFDSTHPTTPSSTAPPSTTASVATKLVSSTPPAVPVVVPRSKAVKVQSISTNASKSDAGTAPVTPTTQSEVPATPITTDAVVPPANDKPEPVAAPAPPPAPAKPASWADLLKTNNQKTTVATPAVVKTNRPANGLYGTLEEALSAFRIHGDVTPPPFLEPRGLVNTGNMCFMNAILQMLVFCGPFYYFLDRVSAASAKSFKDDTPLIETMILFMREFRVITKDSKSKIKSDDLEALGEPFAPEYFYEAIRKLKRFSHMRRGHQQDAEEFLGFLLDGLHEEAVEIMKKVEPRVAPKTNGVLKSEEAGWLEVGHKQKTTTTRTTEITESPITKIFGGTLRSVFSVPGLTKSVTKEPYTPLQLDIQAPEVKSVVDALKHLTFPEKIHGDFKSPKGPGVAATKQVFIETLPPVLILHLKRFQYDNKGGTQKIWKKIAYPLELEIPREAMSSAAKPPAPPKYRLIGVVYHHGSSAQGGHYTVDVLRQDAKTWIRFDDTTIQRVASKDVAIDVKDIGKYNDFDGEEQEGWVNNWEQVNGSGSSGNGQSKGEGKRYVGKDSKVAYILFYQRI